MPERQRLIGVLTLCVALLSAGCSSVAVRTVRFTEVQTYPATYPDLVEVLRAAPMRPHARLGEVYVEPEGDASAEAIEAGLQKGAAPLGADAVVIVADRTLKMGALVETSWEKRDAAADPRPGGRGGGHPVSPVRGDAQNAQGAQGAIACFAGSPPESTTCPARGSKGRRTIKRKRRCTTKACSLLFGSFAVLALVAGPAAAQQVTGELGSPSATTTIDGKQLPPPDPKFGGVINEKASESKPWWAPRVVPPKGAPNVLLIMTDDVGFGAPGTFGGVVPTPATGSHREERAALHQFPLDGALLADAGGDRSPDATTTRWASGW